MPNASWVGFALYLLSLFTVAGLPPRDSPVPRAEKLPSAPRRDRELGFPSSSLHPEGGQALCVCWGGGQVVQEGQCARWGQTEAVHPVPDIPSSHCSGGPSSCRQNPIPEKTSKWGFEARLSRHSCGLDSSHPIPKSSYRVCF